MPSYTHTTGTKQEHLSAALAVPYPAGVVAGDLLVLYKAVRDFNGATVGTSPSGFTLMATSSPGTSDASWCYARKADGTESGTVSLDTNATAGQAACMVRFPAPAGYTWPAVGTAFVGATEASSASSTALNYAARTTTANGNLVVQFAKKPSSGTLTDIATTSGWTQCIEGFGSGGFIMAYAAQYREVSGNAAANSETITTEGTSSATGGLTVEFAPQASATNITVDDGTIDPLPTTVVTITKSIPWNGAVSATIGGSAITLTDINTTQKSTPVNISHLLPGGSWNAISPLSTATLAVTDTDGTFTTEVQIVFSPSTAEDYVASPGAGIGTFLEVPGAVTGDPHFAFWHLGDGVRDKGIFGSTDAGTGYFAPVTLPSQGRLIAYDVSGAVWLAHVDTVLFDAPGGHRWFNRTYIAVSIGV